MMKSFRSLMLVAVMAGAMSGTALASEAVDNLLGEYRSQGAGPFSAADGESFWNREFEGGSCTSCHGVDPKQPGKHQRTGKPIEPMAPSVNAQRLTEVKQINKWFLRNCKGVLGRECSAQEKGDILTWLQTQ